jgi:hypothetical protein
MPGTGCTALCDRHFKGLTARYHIGTILDMAMTLRLSEEDDRRLTELAAAEGRSKQDIIKLALADRWARLTREEQLGEVLSRVLPRYRDLLDRLGPA